MDINEKYLKEYEEMEKKYPDFMKRIERQGEWLSIMFWKIYDFLKSLGLAREFINKLNEDENIVFKLMLELREGKIDFVEVK